MHARRLVAVTSVSLVFLGAPLLGAEGKPTEEELTLPTGVSEAGACVSFPSELSLSPAPIPLQSCGFCGGEDFCPQEGVRCSWQGTCEPGPNHCCNYSCQCDAACTSVSQPEEACSFEVPTCPQCPPRTLCQVSYCGDEGIRCTFSGTCGAGGCCGYDCAPDAGCTAPDPLPPNAC